MEYFHSFLFKKMKENKIYRNISRLKYHIKLINHFVENVDSVENINLN